jgi:cytidine deaminase
MPNAALYAQLLETARKAAEQSYAPYSKVARGAALLADDGTVTSGSNVEFVSYGGSVCAELAALAQAVGSGKRKFTCLALAPVGFPCGSCRQALSEFGLDLELISEREDGSVGVKTLAELLPRSFGKSHLG